MARWSCTIEDVSRFYDAMTDFLHVIMGESIHLGYWPDPQMNLTMPEAQEQFTDLMIRKVEIQPGQRMLDVGCGTGMPAIRLTQATGGTVLGITINQMQVERANDRARQQGVDDRVRFEYANMMELPYADATFDAAWAFESLFHAPDRIQALREIARVVRPGGRIVLADVIEAVPMTEEQKYTFLTAFAANTLTPLEAYYQDLQTVGFTNVDCLDVTANILPSVTTMASNLQQPQIQAQLRAIYQDSALVDSFGPFWAAVAETIEQYVGYVVLVLQKR